MPYEYVKLVPTPTPAVTDRPTTNPIITWANKNVLVVISIALTILIYFWMRPVTFPGDLFDKWLERIKIALLGVPPPIQTYVDMRISSAVAAQVAEQLAAAQQAAASAV